MSVFNIKLRESVAWIADNCTEQSAFEIAKLNCTRLAASLFRATPEEIAHFVVLYRKGLWPFVNHA